MIKDLFYKLVKEARKEGVQKLVVGAVIKKDDRILLLERPKDDFMGGIYELPSGNVEEGETLYAGLVREIKEETNLDIQKVIKYIGHFDYTSGNGKKARQFNFLVSVKGGEVKLSEHDYYCWATTKDYAYSKLTDSVKKILASNQ